jgi:cbb3-type cytochrome oxidase subunit 3
MFGFSLSKTALLLVVIAAVWFAYRIYARGKATREKAASFGAPEEMRPCKTCGSFVAASAALPCGRADCPFST